jgi:predicted dehydrogenase
MNVVFRDDQYLPTQGVYASTWRADAALAGSGVLLEHSIHDLDLLEWLSARSHEVAPANRTCTASRASRTRSAC